MQKSMVVVRNMMTVAVLPAMRNIMVVVLQKMMIVVVQSVIYKTIIATMTLYQLSHGIMVALMVTVWSICPVW